MQNIFVFVTIVSSSMVIIVDVANVVVFHYSGESPRRQFLITQSNHYLSKGKGFYRTQVYLGSDLWVASVCNRPFASYTS